MSEINKPETLRRKYWEYIDKNKHDSSLADLGIREPSLIDLNVFVEILLESLIKHRKLKTVAKIILSEFFIKKVFLSDIKHSEFLSDGYRSINLFDELPQNKKFDLVFSSFPWGLKIDEKNNPDRKYSFYTYKNKTKSTDFPIFKEDSTRTSYEFIRSVESLKMLSEDGVGVCFLPPYFRSFELFNFREVLFDNGFFIESIIKTPNNLLKKITSIESLFIIVSRNKKESEFFYEPDSVNSLPYGMDSFHKNKYSDHIKDGIWLDGSNFDGFINWKYKEELKEIAGDFSKYSEYTIDEICLSINRSVGGKTPRSFEDIENCVYLPFYATLKDAIVNKDDIQDNERSYFQLVVNTKLVLPEYLASFLNSKLGKTYLKSNQGTISHGLPISILRRMKIGIPEIDQQKEIIRNIKKISKLKEKIENFANNLSINPISDHKTLNKVDSMMEIISELSDSDVVRSIIRRGEDDRTEFKQTLSLDIATQKKEKYITESALKTIAAFFNTKGGDLVIGVDDDANITGIENELNKFHKGDNDKFLNTFKDLFKKHIGPEFYPFINQRIISINNKKVFLVTCEPTDREVFINGIDFYVRTTPATDKLEGPSQIDYIRTRFGG